MNDIDNSTSASQQPSDIERVIIQTVKTKGKMTAVKTYMDITGHGLKDSKEAVEGIISKYAIHEPEGNGGCAGVLALGLLILLLIYLISP